MRTASHSTGAGACPSQQYRAGSQAITVALVLWSGSAWAATLTWDANTEPRLAGYKVYRCHQLPCTPTTAGATLVATLGKVTSLDIGTPAVVQYYVTTAYDSANVESTGSNVATYTPPPAAPPTPYSPAPAPVAVPSPAPVPAPSPEPAPVTAPPPAPVSVPSPLPSSSAAPPLHTSPPSEQSPTSEPSSPSATTPFPSPTPGLPPFAPPPAPINLRFTSSE